MHVLGDRTDAESLEKPAKSVEWPQRELSRRGSSSGIAGSARGCSGASAPKARLGPGRNTPWPDSPDVQREPLRSEPHGAGRGNQILPMTAYYQAKLKTT